MRQPLSLRLPLLLVALTACGFPRPPALTDAAPPGDDAATGPGDDAVSGRDAAVGDALIPRVDAQPGTEIRVAGTGDDSNDGFTAPVKTLKHAIGLAAANSQVSSISLASGRYSTAGGETFPYTVPANVLIVGPAGGGAILAGSNTEPGLIVGSGTALQDLELEDFTVAITATGETRLSNVHVRTATLALQVETAAKVTSDRLDITGTGSACAKGLVLVGAAQFAATSLATRNLGITLDASDESISELSHATISGTRACAGEALRVTTSQTFALNDSLVDNGDVGLQMAARAGRGAPHITLSNTTIRNMKSNGLSGGDAVTFTMTGGSVSNNGRGGFEGGGGSYVFTSVVMQDNAVFGIYYAGTTLVSPALQVLTMRDCTVAGVQIGVYLDDGTFADLGTAASHGNNRFRSIQHVGLFLGGSTSPRIDAVGNIWRPAVQGAGADGSYPANTPPVTVPVPTVGNNNYAIARSGISLYL